MGGKKGIERPRFTQYPNILLDHYMSELSGSAFKVVSVICRETFGWQRKEQVISLSYLSEKTGLSKQGVINGINECLEAGLLERREKGRGFAYRLIVKKVDHQPDDMSKKLTSTSQKSGQDPVNSVDTIKERKKEKEEINQPPKESAPADVEAADPAAFNCFTLYEQNIGALTPLIADHLRDFEDTYGEEWLRQAIEVAAERNKRSIRYIEATLKGCAAEGKPPKAPIQGPGVEVDDRRRFIDGDYADEIEF